MMPNLVFPAPPAVTVPVDGTDACFPVRRIYCVGRNYSAHVREMGGDERDPPFFFQKPTDAIVRSGSVVPYPPKTQDLHYEVELVLAIGKAGCDIALDDAAKHVFGLAVGIDFTRRDLQARARKLDQPWEAAKAFDLAAPITSIVPLSAEPLPVAGQISLRVNEEVKQQADLSEMIWNCAEVVSILSTYNKLVPGDLIYTGTPAGIGPVVPHDELLARVDGLPELRISIGERA